MQAFAIPFLLAVGALLALQAAANVQLSAAVGSPFAASTLQLAIGAAVLLVAALVLGAPIPRPRRDAPASNRFRCTGVSGVTTAAGAGPAGARSARCHRD